jgi:hypothetical protein
LFLTGWFRTRLAARPEPECAGVVVDNKHPEPKEVWPEKLLVVRYDGGTPTSAVTDEATIGLTVYAGSKSYPQPAVNLARIVRAMLQQVPAVEPGNPVAAVITSNGPIAIPDDGPLACRYITADLSVAGTAFV